MREFTNEGPVEPDLHYCIPPLERMDSERVLKLIRRQKYFILHAPRQTGKTSALKALQDHLNSGAVGDYRCLYVNVEAAEVWKENIPQAMEVILRVLAGRAQTALGDDSLDGIRREVLAEGSVGVALWDALRQWSRADPRPLVLLVDEIDALQGDTLLSVLRQLRSGYDERPDGFPHSIVLCGVRDVRDYRIRSGATGETVTGGSAFNISAASLRLGDFDRAEVETLLGQHTAETGQAFEPAALERVWTQTQGQPWLVNALCSRACFEDPRGLDRGRAITEDDILAAQEVLIQGRVVHLDQLADKLREARVRRVIEPLLSGGEERGGASKDLDRLRDLEYVRDLGLIARDDPPRIANPIYTEVVPRELTAATQGELPQQAAWYVDGERGLNGPKLLGAFQDFFRQHSEHWLKRFDYEEAGPQLLLQAFLQRVANGGGRVAREYGLGRGRTDVLMAWPRATGEQRIVIECKILRGRLESTIRAGLAQTAEYVDRCAAEEGHLVIFDREKRLWKEKAFQQKEVVDGTPMYVWGM